MAGPDSVAKPTPPSSSDRSGEPAIRELDLLRKLGETIASVLDMDELLRQVLSNCLTALRSDSGSIFIYDGESRELTLKVAMGPRESDLRGIKQKLGEGISGLVADSRKPLLVTDVSKDPRFQSKSTSRYQANSFLCAPIIAENDLVGIINVNTGSPERSFTDNDLQLLSILAQYAAISVRKIDLYHRTIRFNEELQQKVGLATSEIRETNVRLQELTNYNRNIVDSLSQGLLIFNRDLRVGYSNRTAELFFEKNKAGPVHTHMGELLGGERQKELEDSAASVLKEGINSRFEKFPFRTHEGRTRILTVTISPLASTGRDEKEGLLLFEDVTENIELEKRLANSEKFAAIGELAASVAHELNNPLDGVLRFVKMTIEHISDRERVLDYLESARMGLHRMSQIVSSLLTFSRNTDTDLKPRRMHAVLTDVLHNMNQFLMNEGIEVQSRLSPDGTVICGGDLHQVFSNLLKNAFDAIEGRGLVEVTSEIVGDRVQVRVSDTGCGITQENLTKVFEPFFTTKELGKGTGLGLAICKSIVEKYSGEIRIESKPGAGTAVEVILPVAGSVEGS